MLLWLVDRPSCDGRSTPSRNREKSYDSDTRRFSIDDWIDGNENVDGGGDDDTIDGMSRVGGDDDRIGRLRTGVGDMIDNLFDIDDASLIVG